MLIYKKNIEEFFYIVLFCLILDLLIKVILEVEYVVKDLNC